MTRNGNDRNSEDMLQARARTTFDVEEVRNILFGSAEELRAYMKIIKVLSVDPVFDKSERMYITRSEYYNRVLRIMSRLYQLKDQLQWSEQEFAIASLLTDEHMGMGLHAVAFEPVLMSQGSPELLTEVGSLVANRGILGCYLQTELGHGTNVAELETTATYDRDREEFVIDSPTLSSTKWWIGGLGKTATHGVVQAQLILPGGKRIGPHLFFVQLRSLETHKPLPGIRIGDIGPKALSALPGLDNGFARFNNLRIPRRYMLSKFAQVTSDGLYIQPPHTKLSYGGMLYIRSTMVTSAGRVLAKAATVSIRYATVRRQGNKGADGLERQVITYPSQYYRLFPILARAYVYILLGRNLSKSFDHLASRLSLGDTSTLPEMHAITSGLKVLISTTSVADIEVARRSMGGHGYSAYAGLGRLYAEHLPSATYEGDNFVLDQQVVRAALKSFRAFRDSSRVAELSQSTAYLQHLSKSSPQSSVNPGTKLFRWTDPAQCIQLLEQRAARLVAALEEHADYPDPSEYQRVSKGVTDAFVAARVGEMIKDMSALTACARDAVTRLFILFLQVTVESGLTDILSFNLLGTPAEGSASTADPARQLRMAIDSTCRSILPDAIGLTDAFAYTDWELDSALGVYDGRVYEALWERVQTEPLNQKEVPDGYEEFIKPVLQRGQVLANRAKPRL